MIKRWDIERFRTSCFLAIAKSRLKVIVLLLFLHKENIKLSGKEFLDLVYDKIDYEMILLEKALR